MNITPEFFANLISNLFGTLVGAALAYWIALRQFRIQKESENQQKRMDRTLAFYDELISNDLSLARLEANKIFEEHRTASSLDGFYSTLPKEKRLYIQMVLSYFRRLQLAIEYKCINNKMVLDLLSEEFLWWYFMWLDKMVPADWETRKNIDKMDQWLQNTMPTTTYEHSKKNVLQRREKRLAELQLN